MRKSPRLPQEALEPYMLAAPQPGRLSEPPPAPLDWAVVFGNSHPVEIEVGFGKGLFLVTASGEHPDTNYLGIEIVRKYQLFTATRLAKRERRNVRVACTDARPFLRDWVAPGSVQAVHLYFPDPWWKKRHHTRRVFTPEFAQTCQRILKPDGQLIVVTDVADYAEMVQQTVRDHTQFVEAEPPSEKPPGHDMDYLTNFERKFRQEGRPIHRMRFLLTPS
ncbi:MAG: tRNA (guanosine(46)-N7)-methyltransferase TrmB [Gemmataceae bacterium]